MVHITEVLEEIHKRNQNVGYVLLDKEVFVGRLRPELKTVPTPHYIDTITRFTKISIDGTLTTSNIKGCLKYVNAELRGLDLIGFLFTAKLDELYVCED